MLSFSNCKINIGLNIISKREDGYHNIDSLFYPIKLCDIVEVLHSTKFEIINLGLKIDCSETENLCYKAYSIMKKNYNIDPIKIILYKKVPFGSGLGAGSANAAYTIKLINEMKNLNISIEEMKNIASSIGSDCSFFIENKASIVSGKGDILQEINLNLNEYKIVIALPKIKINTKKAYLAVTPYKQEISLKEKFKKPINEWKNYISNDFESYAFSIFPELQKIKEKFYEKGAIYSQMSGSGSSIFAIFEEIPNNIYFSDAKIIII